MNWASWIILIESVTLVPALGWIVFREIVHARTMALVNLAIDDLKIEIDRLDARLKDEVR